MKYKIIIPKEEPKQYPIGGYAPGNYSCNCVICKTTFQGDKRAFQCEPCAIKLVKEEPKQETLEETADKLSDELPIVFEMDRIESFLWVLNILNKGAKWQQEQIGKSEFLQRLRATISDAEARRLIFEQFKNKKTNLLLTMKQTKTMKAKETNHKLFKQLF